MMELWPWPSKWRCLWGGVLAFVLFLGGIESSRVDLILFGAILLFVATSAYVVIESEHRSKRALKVVLMLVIFGVVIYGYVVTGSFILGVTTLIIVAMVLFAFVVSYLLPKIRSKSRGYSQDHLKEE